MTYIIKKDGTEVNRIVADEAFVQQHYSTGGYSYELEPPAQEAEPVMPEPVPTAEELLAVLLGEASE